MIPVLADLLAPDRVQREGGMNGKKQVFEHLAALLGEGSGHAPAAIVAALQEREKLGTTGFGHGVAIPHGRLPGHFPITAAVLLLEEPLDWQAVDAEPVDFLVALVAPEEAGAEHLKALAMISRTLRDPTLLAKLRGAANSDSLWALLQTEQKRAA